MNDAYEELQQAQWFAFIDSEYRSRLITTDGSAPFEYVPAGTELLIVSKIQEDGSCKWPDGEIDFFV